MVKKNKNKEVPMWLRVLRDPEAKKWLAKHKREFPAESFLPDPIAFADKRVLAREKVASVIKDGMPYEDERQQRLAELVLEHPPRKVASILRITRKETYLRIRALKRAALTKWRAKRDRDVLERAKLRVEPTEPRVVRNRMFEYGGQQQTVYLITNGAVNVWVDEVGHAFARDVQEILNDLDGHKDAFETLDVADPAS